MPALLLTATSATADGGLCLISATVGRRGCGSQQERRHVVPHDTDERLLGLAGRVGPESDLPLDGRDDQKELAVEDVDVEMILDLCLGDETSEEIDRVDGDADVLGNGRLEPGDGG